MRLEILSLLILAVVYVSAQSAIEPSKKDDGRLFVGTGSFSFTTFTLIKTSTTITSTLTSVSTCTTSTAALKTCVASARRRRGLFYNADDKQRSRRGLFYDEEEEEEKDGSIFLPVAQEDKSRDPVAEVPSKAVSEDVVIPLEVQSGFSGDVLPADFDSSRFLLAFGTKTITSFVISTSTSSLIALCSSTTGFAVCAVTGK